MINNKDKLWTVKEVAEYLQLDEHTIYRMARRGEIPAYKIAGKWRFKREMIEEWLNKNFKGEIEK
jgi:excisionase family DNA binding protein